MEQVNKVKGYRIMAGISQEEMAAALGITRASYNNKETGKQQFKASEMIKLVEEIQKKVPTVTMDDVFM